MTIEPKDLLDLLNAMFTRGLLAAAETPLDCEPDHEEEKGSAAHLRTAIIVRAQGPCA